MKQLYAFRRCMMGLAQGLWTHVSLIPRTWRLRWRLASHVYQARIDRAREARR